MYDLDNGTENIKVNKIAFIDASGSVMLEIDADSGTCYLNRNKETYLSVDDGYMQLSKPIAISGYATINRPTTLSDGVIIYDSTLGKLILWNGTAWVNLDGTALS